MGETQEVIKLKNKYIPWSTLETKTLLRLLVDGVNQNWRDASGSFNKLTVEKRILPDLNRIFGSVPAITHERYRSKMKTLKNRYKCCVDLLRHSSGFGWDPNTKKFTVRQDIWEGYLEGHPNHKHLRDDSFEDFEDLTIIFGQNTAIGMNAIGLGEATDARIYGARDNEWDNEDVYIPRRDDVDDDEDLDDDGVEKLDEQVVSSLSGRKSNEKVRVKKKARIEQISDDISSMTGMNNEMFSLIQQRWQQEVEEKQAEEKNNNVWAAIKEIPDLEENVRFDAMNLVHQMGMKAGFVSMTIQERLGWIKRSVLKH